MMTQGDPGLTPDLLQLLRVYFPDVPARTARLRGGVRPTGGSIYCGAINICRRIHRVEMDPSQRTECRDISELRSTSTSLTVTF